MCFVVYKTTLKLKCAVLTTMFLPVQKTPTLSFVEHEGTQAGGHAWKAPSMTSGVITFVCIDSRTNLHIL
jgi:hypothetical protein